MIVRSCRLDGNRKYMCRSCVGYNRSMRKYLVFTIFISGMASLAVEMTASRLLGNYFGSSNLIWAVIVGLILIYLTAGYFLGGRWSDQSPHFATFYRILAWSGFLVGVIPLVSRPILRLAANAFDELALGGMVGAFVTVLILFSAPVTLMGTASPFAIRLSLHDSRHAGSIAGKIYAISTLGSFLGTFLPGLLLVPLIGTFRTFVAIGGILLVTALVGLWLDSGFRKTLPWLWMPVILVILAILGTQGTDKNSSGLVYETESAYNYIQVLEQDGYTLLRLNEGQGVHSIYHPSRLNYYGPWEQVAIAPFFNPAPYSPDFVQRTAIVGLAAGTTARQMTEIYGTDLIIDGYEIDPKIVDVAHQFFDMNMPNLNVFVQDGRTGLAASPHQYQVISVDAYRPPYIPWHLTTVEFFNTVHEHLSSDGVMIINVGRTDTSRQLIDELASTILAIFPSVHVVDLPYSYNSLLFATVQPTDSANLLENFSQLQLSGTAHPLLLETMQIAIANLQPTPQSTIVYTDDLAPVELVTNQLVLSYLFSPHTDPIP